MILFALRLSSLPLASVRVGDKVLHHLFGNGFAEKITYGTIINPSGMERQFQFPRTFQNGFLRQSKSERKI